MCDTQERCNESRDKGDTNDENQCLVPQVSNLLLPLTAHLMPHGYSVAAVVPALRRMLEATQFGGARVPICAAPTKSEPFV